MEFNFVCDYKYIYVLICIINVTNAQSIIAEGPGTVFWLQVLILHSREALSFYIIFLLVIFLDLNIPIVLTFHFVVAHELYCVSLHFSVFTCLIIVYFTCDIWMVGTHSDTHHSDMMTDFFRYNIIKNASRHCIHYRLWLQMIHGTQLQLKCVGDVSVQQPCRLLWLNPSPIVTFHVSYTVTLHITHTHTHTQTD